MADIIMVRLEIRGRVQGVYYRASMVEQAQREGLRGWVRNRRDGSVEAVLAGEAQAVERVIVWARRGPPQASVSSVERFAVSGEFTGFEQRSTL